MPSIAQLIISLFFLAGSLLHFFLTDFFLKIMPDYLGYHFELVIISGVFELFGAIGILFQKTRLIAGYGLIVLSVLVFPANVNMALQPQQFQIFPEYLLYLRLPLQLIIIGFIWWAVRPNKSVY